MASNRWKSLRHKARQSLVGLFIGGAASGCVNGAAVQTPPMALPFDVSRAEQSVDAVFDIREDAFYGFNLVYLFRAGDQQDRARVVGLVGATHKDPASGQWVTPGAPLIIHLKVVEWHDDRPGRVMYEGEVRQPVPFASGASDISVRLQALKLAPGRFKATVRSVKEASALKEVQAEFRVVRAYMGK